MKLAGILLVTSVALASPAYAADTINFGSPTGNLGTSETYTTGSLTVVAKGFNQYGQATDLWGKNQGGDEIGLGLKNDPSGDHEIYYGKGFVQIDVSQVLGLVDQISFFTNSTTQGEQWTVFGSNSSGHYSVLNSLISGTNEASAILPGLGDWKYYDFVSTSKSGGKNFLLSGMTFTASGVPEPATWAMMLLGIGALGTSMRRRNALRTKVNYA